MPGIGLKHNVLYNILGSVIPVIVALITIPTYLHTIGTERYGVLSLIWIVFGYFGLFDFGLSRATAHRLSVLSSSDLKTKTTVFYTACCLNAALGISIAVIFYVIGVPLLDIFLSKTTFLREEIFASLPWIAIFFPLGLVSGVLVGCLEANERFLELNFQQVVGNVLQQCLPLALVYWFGPHLQFAVIGVILARGVSTAWLAVSCLRWAFPAGRPRVERHYLKDLLRYGGWVTVSNSIAPILNGLDQLIIGAMLGANAVAHYSVSFSIASKALIVPGSLTRALFPQLSRSSAEDAQELSHKGIAILGGAMALICAPAILLADIGLGLWVGQDFAREASPTAKLLLVGIWLNGLAFIPYTLLQGQNRPDIIAKLHAFEALPFVLILSLFIGAFGLPGAGLAWSIRVAADGGLMFWSAGLTTRSLRELLAPGLAMLLSLFVAMFFRLDVPLALAGSLTVSLFLSTWMFIRYEMVSGAVRTVLGKLAKVISVRP